MTAYGIRFRGHWCAAVKTGFSRKPILIRARKGEEPFAVEVDAFHDGSTTAQLHVNRVAHLECARAIKRTNEARKRLAAFVANSTLAGESLPKIKTAARLMADAKTRPNRRGKVWKICPLPVGGKKELEVGESNVLAPVNPGN